MTNEEPDLEDFEMKARPGAAIHIAVVGRELVLESFEDVVAKLGEASPGDHVEFTGYTDFPSGPRVIQRLYVMAAAVVNVEEISDTWLEAIDKQRESKLNDVPDLPPSLAALFKFNG